jgi:MoaA/NifB/PqqE/SkfB family radical SAM enzyme
VWKETRVVLTGGEPTLYPELLDYLGRTLTEQGHPVVVSTNGTRLGVVRELEWVSELIVSLPSVDAATYRALRGADYFAKVKHFIKDRVAAGIRVTMAFTIASHNVGQAGEAVSLARRLGASRLSFEVVYPIGGGKGYRFMVSPDELAAEFESIRQIPNMPIRFPAVGKTLPLVLGGQIVADLNGNFFELTPALENMLASATELLHGSPSTLFLDAVRRNRALFNWSEADGENEFRSWSKDRGDFA